MAFPWRMTSFAAPAAGAAASALAYPFLPGRVATHFGLTGQADRYSRRPVAAVGLPVVMAVLGILNDRLGTWPVARDPARDASGERVRDEAVGLTEVALLLTHLVLLANALALPLDTQRLLRAIYSLLIVALANLMPRLPRNGLVGIRTPWTLADPAVWERTHRLAGYLFLLAGLVGLASLPAQGKRAERIPILAVLGAVGLSAAYSAVAARAPGNR